MWKVMYVEFICYEQPQEESIFTYNLKIYDDIARYTSEIF
jgi:hypothetical protein